ncbi:hypothetical protein Tco_0601111, partial [Tanacetum coccineum]
MPFEEGRLPVKVSYLGVPLVPSRLVYKDSKELIEKVDGRINDWKNKSLSIAGSLQLMQSVITSLHVYWASMFVLPTRVLLDIEQHMRKFLWCQGNMRKGKAKVAWDLVCLPKDEGGLGVKRLDLFNKALMSSHVWKLLVRKDSLWVKWIHTYKIKHRNFWDIPCRGNGQNISIWYDRWCPLSTLANFVSTRDMYRASLNMSSTLEWRTHSGAVKKFTVSTVWQAIRTRDVKIETQDILMSWDLTSTLVWKHMIDLTGLSQKHYNIYDVVSSILPVAKRRTSDSVIIKLVIAASAYFLWQERNERLFKNNKRSVVQVIECITSSIWLKLFSCRFKNSKRSLALMRRWKIPEVEVQAVLEVNVLHGQSLFPLQTSDLIQLRTETETDTA